jgi:hypothetical protein
MKAYRLVRQSQVLTVLSSADAERMLDTGDYVMAAAKPKARGKDAKRMRGIRQRRRLAGWIHADLWIPPEVVGAISAVKLQKESYLKLFIRLVKKERDSLLIKSECPKDN